MSHRIVAIALAVLTVALLASIAATGGAPAMLFVLGGMALASFVLVASVPA